MIDYSAYFFEEVSGLSVPEQRNGKFIQVRDSDTEYLVLSPKRLSPYHANIAERFFLARGIAGTYNRKRDHYTVHDPDWVIAGGGIWEIDDEARKLSLSGTSMAYGGYDPRGLARRLRSADPLSGYRIKIDT
jgi:hypothetical protein